LRASKIDRFGIGIVIALLGLVISFFGFGLYWSKVNNTSLDYYINEVFLGMNFFQDSILTLSVLFDIVLFALFYQLKHYKLCKGILLVVLISVPVILYFY
jgi:hypothetical protein